MLRSRGTSPSGAPRPSTYQVDAKHLIYAHAEPWRDMTLQQVRHHIGAQLPANLRATWQRINSGQAAAPSDREAAPLIDW
eukprot:1553480-Prorocentrum_lima.AAC.1